MDRGTYQVLRRYNSWLTEPESWPAVIERHLPERFVPRRLHTPFLIKNNKISLIIGPRQAGKSTLIWNHIKDSPEFFLFVNCEEPACRELCKSPALFLEEIERIADPCPGLFFDEIQHLPEAGLFLKGLADMKPGVPIIVTGSASYHLKSKTRESLAGRAARFLLLPFGMAELVPAGLQPQTIEEQNREKVLGELLLWGGYPEVFLSKDKENILSQLVEAFVLRDASDFHRIKRPDAFRRVLSLAAAQVGNLVNYSNWAESAGISVNTVIEYVNILEESHLIRLVPPFVGGKRAEITSTPKVFFYDNGLRNMIFGGFAPIHERGDRGAIVENYIFSEICKNRHPLLDSIHFWRSTSGAEVDFIIRTPRTLTAIEVKSGQLKKPRISRSLRSFIKAYAPDQVVVFNSSLSTSIEVEACEVVFEKLVNTHKVLQ
jgi:predicted AAA+ superfamily ATPase